MRGLMNERQRENNNNNNNNNRERERGDLAGIREKFLSGALFSILPSLLSLSLLFFVREPLFSSSVGFLTKQTEEGFG